MSLHLFEQRFAITYLLRQEFTLKVFQRTVIVLARMAESVKQETPIVQTSQDPYMIGVVRDASEAMAASAPGCSAFFIVAPASVMRDLKFHNDAYKTKQRKGLNFIVGCFWG